MRERRGRGMLLERVRAQGVAKLAHERGGMEATPGHVADHHADPAALELEHVVPVSAHVDARSSGHEARRQADAGNLREAFRHEAALQHVGAPAFGDVADGARHQRARFRLERAEADLDGELRAVLAQAPQLDRCSGRPAPGDSEGMGLAEALRHERVHVPADDLVAGAAEEPLRLSVDELDRSLVVRDHHRVRCGLDQLAELLLGPPLLGDVLHGAEDPQRLAAVVGRDLAAAVQDADDAVGPDDAVLEGERRVIFERPVQRAVDRVPVLRVDVAQQSLVARGKSTGGQAVDAIQLIGPGDLVGRDVPLPAADVRDVLRFSEQRDAAARCAGAGGRSAGRPRSASWRPAPS